MKHYTTLDEKQLKAITGGGTHTTVMVYMQM